MSWDSAAKTTGSNELWGLNIWSDEPETGSSGLDVEKKVDIILVQGLASDPIWAWRSQKPRPARERAARQNSGPASFDGLLDDRYCFWPRDLLPADIPHARIFTYAYRSQWQSNRFNTNIRECGQQMLYYLSVKRDTNQARTRPIIFLGHSFGGLVIQSALATARDDSRFIKIVQCCVGIICLGTPFQGTPYAGLLDFLNKTRLNKQPIIEALKPNSKELKDLQARFVASIRPNPPRIVCYYEQLKSIFIAKHVLLVSQESACLPGELQVAMHADHRGMNKFHGSDDSNYIQLLFELKVMCHSALGFRASHDIEQITSDVQSGPTLVDASNVVLEYNKSQSEEFEAEEVKQQAQEEEAAKEQTRRENSSAQRIRYLRQLMRKKYKLDIEIWEARGVRKAERPLVMRRANEADRLLVEIQNIVQSWDEGQFELEEWQLANKIKNAVLDPEEPYVSWIDSPRWDRQRASA